jgi:hypothetical protein
MIEEMAQPSASLASTATLEVFEVSELCQVSGVSRSGFYAHQHKGQSLRQREDRALVGHLSGSP